MGNTDINGNYTNENVKEAVKKITDNEVEENAQTVLSKKKNSVDISDLWEEKLVIYIKKLWTMDGYVEVPFKRGQVWNEEFLENLKKSNYGKELEWRDRPNGSTFNNAQFEFLEDGLVQIRPDNYSWVGMYYGENQMVYKGDLLSENAHYEYKQM